METPPAVALLAHFAQLPDPRREHRRRHKLSDILVMAVCAVLCGAESFPAMEDFGYERAAWLQQFLELIYPRQSRGFVYEPPKAV